MRVDIKGFLPLGVFAVVLGLATALPSLAFEPLRDPRKLRSPKSEKVGRVISARVVLADYDLIRKDFPWLGDWEEWQVDAWVLEQAGYLALTQARQTVTNTTVSIDLSRSKEAYRPRDYGRALVFSAQYEGKMVGLIDAKGAGARKPHLGDHANGLMTLGEAIREFLYEKLVREILKRAEAGVETVGTYGVLDLGFDVKFPESHQTIPAGMVIRQAHRRSSKDSSSLGGKQSLKIERILRRFGVTSAGAYRDEPVEKINIQGVDGEKAMIDFGTFLTVPEFIKPAKNFDGFRILLNPKKQDFVQAEPDIRVPWEIWGYGVTGRDDPQWDNPWVWSHDLARALRDGTADRGAANRHWENLMRPVLEKWNKNCAKLLSASARIDHE